MEILIVDGDEIELTPDPPWRWMAPPVRLKLIPAPTHRMKAKGKFVIWESEILQSGLLAAGQMYSAPGFDTPGAVITVTLTVTPGTLSKTVNDLGLPVGTVATEGTFVATMAPAINPSTGVPDPLVAKTGTWKIASQLQDVASSGQPKAKAADGDDEDGAAGVAAGASDADSGANEHKVHFVAVVVEDIDGNLLGGHRVAISTPDGDRTSHVLTDSGAARVDGIRAEGEAEVRLLDAELRPPVKRPQAPWIALSIIDEDGVPFEGATVEITLPDGVLVTQVTGKKGAIRIDNLKQDGEFDARLVLADSESGTDGAGSGDRTDAGAGDAADGGDSAGSGGGTDGQTNGDSSAEVPSHEVLVQLFDEAGEPRSGDPVLVRWPDGEENEFELDDTGSLRLDVEDVESIEVSFPSYPADTAKRQE